MGSGGRPHLGVEVAVGVGDVGNVGNAVGVGLGVAVAVGVLVKVGVREAQVGAGASVATQGTSWPEVGTAGMTCPACGRGGAYHVMPRMKARVAAPAIAQAEHPGRSSVASLIMARPRYAKAADTVGITTIVMLPMILATMFVIMASVLVTSILSFVWTLWFVSSVPSEGIQKGSKLKL
jgi:hypothetical protein